MRKYIPVIVTILFFGAVLIGFYFTQRRVAVRQEALQFTIGTTADYEPFSFMQNGIIAGLDIDIITEIAQRIGANFTFIILTVEELIPKIKEGMVNVLATGLTETPGRAEDLFFTETYIFGNPFIIIIPVDKPPVRTVEDLVGKKVIVNTGHITDQFLSEIPNLTLIRIPTVKEAFKELMGGEAYAYVNSRSSSEPFLEKYGKNRFHLIPIDGTSDSSAIAVTRTDPQLFEMINQALRDMIADGTVQKLKDKWDIS